MFNTDDEIQSLRKCRKAAKLDDLDKKLLTLLQQDCKLTLQNLKDLTGNSITAIKNHRDKLEELGLIKGYIAVVDCCKLGYRDILIIFIKVSSDVPIREVLEKLRKIEDINVVYHISGVYPILCIAKCLSKEMQIDLIERIKRIKGIEELETKVVFERIKEDYRVKIPPDL